MTAHFLIFAFGSAGDVNPLLGLAAALSARGKNVEVVSCGYFREEVRALGLPFVELGTREEYLKILNDPDLWHPVRGIGVVFRRVILPATRPQYQLIAERSLRDRTVVISNHLGLGARIAQEKLGIPLITTHGAPVCLWSEHDSPVFSPFMLGRFAPRWLKRPLYRIGEHVVIDRIACDELNAFRNELGLRPMRRTSRWWHSPECVLCFFPEWYSPHQPDWPPNVTLTRFPLCDQAEVSPLQPELVSFLARGDAPIVFTAGSANRHAGDFFRVALDACRRLGRRGIFLSRFEEQIPSPLPKEIIHLGYVPFSRLLSQAAAIVHHGGLGTVAQALQAGIPQLIMPLSHDHPDNAYRLRRLGVGETVLPRAFKVSTVAKKLDRLLRSPDVAQRCQDLAGKFRDGSPMDRACEVVEDYADRHLGRMARK